MLTVYTRRYDEYGNVSLARQREEEPERAAGVSFVIKCRCTKAHTRGLVTEIN